MMEESGQEPRKDLFYDHEHPRPLGFLVWAKAIEHEVAKLYGDEPKPPMREEDLVDLGYMELH